MLPNAMRTSCLTIEKNGKHESTKVRKHFQYAFMHTQKARMAHLAEEGYRAEWTFIQGEKEERSKPPFRASRGAQTPEFKWFDGARV
jgi:hypothetical protein